MANGPLIIESTENNLFDLRQNTTHHRQQTTPPTDGESEDIPTAAVSGANSPRSEGSSIVAPTTMKSVSTVGDTKDMKNSSDSNEQTPSVPVNLPINKKSEKVQTPNTTATQVGVDESKSVPSSTAEESKDVKLETQPNPSLAANTSTVTEDPKGDAKAEDPKWAESKTGSGPWTTEERRRKKKKYKYLCKYNNKCVKIAKAGGYCIAHGGGKRCVLPGCEKVARYIGSRCHIHRDLRVNTTGSGINYRDTVQAGYSAGFPSQAFPQPQAGRSSQTGFNGGAYHAGSAGHSAYMQPGNPYHQLNSGSFGGNPQYYSQDSLGLSMPQQYQRQQARHSEQGVQNQRQHQRAQNQRQQHGGSYLNSVIGGSTPHVLPGGQSQYLDSHLMDNLAPARKRSTSGMGALEGNHFFDQMQVPGGMGHPSSTGMMNYAQGESKRIKHSHSSDNAGDQSSRQGISSYLGTPPLPLGNTYGMPQGQSGGSTMTPTLFTHRVDRILEARRNQKGGVEFLVQWKDFGPEYNSWQAQEKFVDDTAIRQFYNMMGTTAS